MGSKKKKPFPHTPEVIQPVETKTDDSVLEQPLDQDTKAPQITSKNDKSNKNLSKLKKHYYFRDSLRRASKYILRKLKYLYSNYRIAFMVVTVLLLAGGGYVVYRSFADTGRDPTEQEVYDYLKSNIASYQGIALVGEDNNNDHELLRVPVVPSDDKEESYVLFVNPKVDLGYFKNGKRCFSPLTPKGKEFLSRAKAFGEYQELSKYASHQATASDATNKIKQKVINEIVKAVIAGNTDAGGYYSCDGSGYVAGGRPDVAPYRAAFNRVKYNISMYGHPQDPPNPDNLAAIPQLSWGKDLLCYSLYPPGETLEKCKRIPEIYTNLPPAPIAVAVTPVFAVPAQDFNNYRQQLVQIALGKGASAIYLKAMCNTYKDPQGCKLFIDQSCDYFKFCGNAAPPAVPVSYPKPNLPPPGPPPCDPRTGCDDGKWQVWPLAGNGHFWANPRLPGRCIYKKSNGEFAVGVNNADYDCNALTQMYKCQNEFSKLDPKNPATFANANISPECGNQSEIRGAGKFVQLYLLSQTVPKGNLEGHNSDCTVQAGWAYSDANKNIPLEVHLYYDGPAGVGEKFIVKADIQREDLKQFGNSGIHGFEFKIPEKFKDFRNHTVYMYAIGIQTNGWTNGKNPFIGQTNFTCDFPPQGNLERVYSGMEKGTFNCKVQGWAFDRSDPNAALQVHAYIDGVPGIGYSAGSAIGTANIYRQDLKNAGQGNGKHGYVIDIPYKFRDAYKHKLRVYALGVFPFAVPNGQNPLIGEVDFQCDDPPKGNVEELLIKFDSVTNTCAIKGWAFDPSSFWSTKVVVYYDFSPDFSTYKFLDVPFSTTLNRPDVKGYGGSYGFVYPIADQFFDDKPHKAYFYALNIDVDGTYTKQNNRFIGSKNFTCHKK